MFQNYFSVAFRNLVKHKLYSAINIIGLAIGLAACVLIMLFVRDELSYDKHWTNADRLHRFHTTFNIPNREPFVTVQAAGPAKHALKNYFPEEIDQVTRFNGMSTVMRYGDGVFAEDIHWTDPETADMFSFDVVAGDVKASLNDNASLVVTESFAEKHFGAENPIGKVVTLNLYQLQRDYRVGAVIKDLPHNTVLDFQALAMIDEKDFENQHWEFGGWFSVNNYVYFTLKEGASLDVINNRLVEFADTNIDTGGATKASAFLDFSIQPMPDIQLDPRSPQGGEMKPTGSMANVLIFSAIAGLILFIACINFMNLATAKSTQRAREVALRKVLGASRGQLVVQFLGESILIAIIGLLLGIVLVETFLQVFSDFVGKDLDFAYGDGMTVFFLLGLVTTVGVLGGAYPALVLSGFMPASVLKANKSAETSGSVALRNILVVLQFSISIALIVATGVVFGQKFYATNMDPGFNKDNLIVIRNVGRAGAQDRQEALREEILRLPGVVGATYTGDAPASGNESNTSVTIPGAENAPTILIGVQDIDYSFLETYQIPLLAGRNYSREFATDGTPSVDGAKAGDRLEGSLIVNEGALRRFGFGTPQEAVGKIVSMNVGQLDGENVIADMKIIGVIPNTHFQSLRTVMRPEMYRLEPENYRQLTVRFEGDAAALASQIEGVWKSLITTVPYAYDYVDEVMAGEFVEETNQSILLAIFAGLAIVVACLGLYGLASFTAERRTKEIGIRKVLGASVIDIVRLLIWQFSKPVLVANLIAWPLAVWGMLIWLETFPYRLETWVFAPLCLVAGAIALLIAWATVGGNAAKVARSNPIKALRYE